jgi:hypothetical protein
MLLSSEQVLKYWLKFLSMKSTCWSDILGTLEGSLPLDLADQWHDLIVGDRLSKYLQLNNMEKSENGLKRFFKCISSFGFICNMHL